MLACSGSSGAHRKNYNKIVLCSKEKGICYKMVYYTLPLSHTNRYKNKICTHVDGLERYCVLGITT